MEKSCELLLPCCLIGLTGNQSHGAQIPVWSVLVPRLCKWKVKERYFRKAEKGDIFPDTVNSSPSQLTSPSDELCMACALVFPSSFLYARVQGLCAGVCEGARGTGVLDNPVT